MKGICFIFLILALARYAHGQQAGQSSPRPEGSSGIGSGDVPARIGKPTILYKERAKYTEEARDQGVHGVVILSAMFTADGRITGIKVIRGLPEGLTEKALEAVVKMRVKPAINKDGQPISVQANVEFFFRLNELDEKRTRSVLRYSFPLLSNNVINLLAAAMAKRKPDSEQVWLMAQWCMAQGAEQLSLSEQEEYQNLKLEAVKSLEAPAKEAYQSLTTEAEQRSLDTSEKMEVAGFLFEGVSKFPGAKRKRLQEIYNQAATLGIKQLDKFK